MATDRSRAALACRFIGGGGYRRSGLLRWRWGQRPGRWSSWLVEGSSLSLGRERCRLLQTTAGALRYSWTIALTLVVLTTPWRAHAGADDVSWGQVLNGTHFLMIRHALAPGGGDPVAFELDNCATQRNLDDVGRAQARAIGDWLRARGVRRADLYSSQWCRCLDTAKLMDVGPVNELVGLNSFYELTHMREGNLRALRDFLARREDTRREDAGQNDRGQKDGGRPLILVTHSVTIAALTGRSVGSGEAVVVKSNGDGTFVAEAVLRFDEQASNAGTKRVSAWYR